jgi:hypothetical protein
MKSGFDITKAYECIKIYEEYMKYQQYQSDYDWSDQSDYDYSDHSDEKMRELFQKCRDRLEDEAKKMEQTQKENAVMKHKIEMVKAKLAKKRKNNVCKKQTFCGFKKGFLL